MATRLHPRTDGLHPLDGAPGAASLRELVLTNARLVLPEREVLGTICVRDGVIADVDSGRSNAEVAYDLDGDYLVPGLIDLHTDNLEKHFTPRPSARWPGLSAVLAHDSQIAATGITSVFDALTLGGSANRETRRALFPEMVEALTAASAAGILRADHRLHIRCEVTEPDIVSLLARYLDNPLVGLMSVMDHSPGQRQYADLAAYRERTLRLGTMSKEMVDRHIETRAAQSATFGEASRRRLSKMGHRRGLAIASHDDSTTEQVEDSVTLGMSICEFPTTIEAARSARANGLAILCGAPNLVRGGSHTGNVSVLELVHAGLIDVLASDYVPVSMMSAAFALNAADGDIALPAAFALIAANPARIVGLRDRGTIEPGRRADLAHVRLVNGTPVIRTVWNAGVRVF